MRWVTHPEAAERRPVLAGYRRSFAVAADTVLRCHVSADERYELYLDGRRVSRGSDRGDLERWHFESLELPLRTGTHSLAALVWSVGNLRPQAQVAAEHGWLFGAEGCFEELSTGLSAWECVLFDGFSVKQDLWRAVMPSMHLDYRVCRWPQWLAGEAEPAAVTAAPLESVFMAADANNFRDRVHRMAPTPLPAQLERPVAGVRVAAVDGLYWDAVFTEPGETGAWQRLWDGAGELTIAPHTQVRVLVELRNYYSGYAEFLVSGGRGAVVEERMAEGMFGTPEDFNTKGRRDQWRDKYFHGFGIRYIVSGAETLRLRPLWWNSGCWLAVAIRTGDEALTLREARLLETGYPFGEVPEFSGWDSDWERVREFSLRTWRNCAHETYMDCPYYEQLMYIGDTRLQSLITFAVSPDRRLPAQALRLLADSQRPNGLTMSRFPSCDVQIIPPFSLWFIGQIRDYAYWSFDRDTVCSLLPVVRRILDYFRSLVRSDGTVGKPTGWNFCDWVRDAGWDFGVAPVGADGRSGYIHALLLLALRDAADLEKHFGEPELAALHERNFAALQPVFHRIFFRPERNLYSDDSAGTSFSEHVQLLALLADAVPEEVCDPVKEALFAPAGQLSRTTYFFSHYYLECALRFGRSDAFMARLEDWREMLGCGVSTALENPEPVRSDCHAWSAHPAYHAVASLAGVRPAAPGFRRFAIRPLPAVFPRLRGEVPHPAGGAIVFELNFEAKCFAVTLPEECDGSFEYAGQSFVLRSGKNTGSWQ